MQPEQTEAVRELVRWSPYAWGGLIAVLATIHGVARAGTWLAMAVASWPLSRYRGDCWSERARLAWPSRRTGRMATVVLGSPAFLAFARSRSGLQVLPPTMLMVAASAVAFWGVLETVIRRESRLNPAYALTPSAARAARISWLLILGPIFLVTIVVACILPDLLNKTAVTILFTIALGVGSYLAWGWAALMRILGVIRPASDRLRSVVERTAEKAGVFPRAVVQVGLPMANAFAFTLEGKLGVTDATLAVLDDEELAAVCAHELAHLREPRRVVWARASRCFLIGLYLALLAASARPLPGSFGPWAFLGGILGASVLLIGGSSSRIDSASRWNTAPMRRQPNRNRHRESMPGHWRSSIKRTWCPPCFGRNDCRIPISMTGWSRQGSHRISLAPHLLRAGRACWASRPFSSRPFSESAPTGL